MYVVVKLIITLVSLLNVFTFLTLSLLST